jgi:hypothetical protein
MDHAAFINGDFDTHFVQKYFALEALDTATEELEEVAAMALASLLQEQKSQQIQIQNASTSRWKQNRS